MSSQTQPFLHGTIRALTQDMSLLVQKRVKTVAEGVAAAFDMEVEVELKQGGYLPVENNPALARELMDFFEEKDGIELIDIEPAMTGEDFWLSPFEGRRCYVLVGYR